MNRLTKYDYVIKHRLCKTNIIRLANKMLRISERYSQSAVTEDTERIIIMITLSQSRTVLSMMKSHIKYRESQWYEKVISFLLNESKALKNLDKNEIRNLKRLSFKYKLTNQHLLYIEQSEEMSKCLFPYEVRRILMWAHNEHDHFAVVIILHKLRGQ